MERQVFFLPSAMSSRSLSVLSKLGRSEWGVVYIAELLILLKLNIYGILIPACATVERRNLILISCQLRS